MPRKSAHALIFRANLLVAGIAVACCAAGLRAQVPAPPPDTEAPPVIEVPAAAPKLDVATLDARLAAIKADPGMEEAAKADLQAKYAEAIEKLKLAGENTKRAAGFREALRSAPVETERLGKQLKTLPGVEGAAQVPAGLTVEALNKDLATQRATLVELQSQLQAAEQLEASLKSRPEEIGTRLPAASSELSGIEGSLAGRDPNAAGTPAEAADLALLFAQREALASEIEMLTQARLSNGVRSDRAKAQRALLERQIENSHATIAALENALKETLRSEADRLAGRVARATAGLGSDDELLTASATKLKELAAELQDSARQLKRANEIKTELGRKITALERTFGRFEEQLKLGGLEGSFSQVMFKQRRTLPSRHAFAHLIKARTKQLQEVRLSSFQVDELLSEQENLEKQQAESPSPAVADLLQLRGEVLEKLSSNYESLVDELARIDAEERSYHNKVLHVREVLGREIFWRRSSLPLGAHSVADVPAALGWFLAPKRWREGWKTLCNAVGRRPILSILIGLAVILLLVGRRRILADIEETGQRIRRISTDRYLHTVRALLGTALLALPVPLALTYLAWAITREPGNTPWVRGMATGLRWAGVALVFTWFFGAACRKHGLGPAHFGWDEGLSARALRALILLVSVQLLCMFPTTSTLYEENAKHFDSMGRLSLNLALILTALILGKYVRPSKGFIAEVLNRHPERAIARFRYVWYSLVVLAPFGLVVLASSGWVLTAQYLSLVFVGTLVVAASGFLIYCLVLRWFMIKERRLVLTQAMEERRARRAAAENPEEQADESIVTDETERELNLDAVGEQTRRLLRSLTGIGIATAVWFLWTRSLPLDEALGEASLFGVNLLGIVQGILLAAVFTTLVRNLPGLLELTGLRTLVEDAGTRYAIATLSQYAVAALGLLMLSSVLQIDWSKLSWIAAALSVGLGFGLQEVVANFVCGIILLFERPIRVGDVVTVNDIDGTVTRIQMRATTITNWDRKEYVVPNKQFITGTLMNWTLTNKINRIVIVVGVAYGSDTRRAREILLEVAADHPRVMDDPAPLATFEQFADSTLNLLLRCYLPNLDNRIATITDLHTDIDERFKEAGIEIAFPQQDLHVRSMDPSLTESLKGT
jgi:potassium efflux system protein